MSLNKFEELIVQLGKELGLPLHAERGRICRLNINGLLHVHIEYDEAKDRVLLATFIAEIPPGKFRENVLKETLRINNNYPRLGTFAYSEKNNQLALFIYTPFASLPADQLLERLMTFIHSADEWRLAIEQGSLARVALPSAGPSGAPPLGVRR